MIKPKQLDTLLNDILDHLYRDMDLAEIAKKHDVSGNLIAQYARRLRREGYDVPRSAGFSFRTAIERLKKDRPVNGSIVHYPIYSKGGHLGKS